jgi:hypothetical protein
MQESFKIKTSKRVIAKLLDGDLEISQYFDEYFSGHNSDYISNDEQLTSAIFAYHLSDGGSPEINGVEISDVTFKYGNLSGTMCIDYTVDRYYGCDDINSSDYSSQTWTFQIDLPNESILFTGPYEYERDPDNY